jgi:RNA polymerase sigma factor (sigma-70 family)
MATSDSRGENSRARAFVTTHWSVVLAAACNDTTRAQAALSKLCQTYWYPLYSHARRRGYSPEDAKDITQAFFARLIEGQSLANADPNRGRFRSFMLAAMNHCLSDHRAKATALKRGGGTPPISLDLALAEERFDLEPRDPFSPDKAFDRQWASTLLDEVLNGLEAEYRADQKEALFDALKPTLVGTRESQPYSVLATQLGMNEGAVRTAVHRFRKRYRELIREEIANTVSSPEEIDDEIRYLLQISASP